MVPRFPLVSVVAFCGVCVANVAGDQSVVSTRASQYPSSWREPPESTNPLRVPLPGGYGHGPLELVRWISDNMANDKALGKVQYPLFWGEPPAIQTRDLRPLPFGYAHGSSTLVRWITEQALEHSNETPEQYDAFFDKNGALRYPITWGTPPTSLGSDENVPLPGGYGHGSMELANWILYHMNADSEQGHVHYPPAWGSPPSIQTLDYVELPFAYGHGSSTLANWIEDQAEKHASETRKEYEAAWASHKLLLL